jgi:hypothetical protein
MHQPSSGFRLYKSFEEVKMFGMLNPVTNFQSARHWNNGRIPGTQIWFDLQLIETLRAEHHEILAACERLEIACDKERVAQIADQLQALEDQLRQHRIQEDVKLMIFVEKRYSDNDEMAALIAMFRKERDSLKRQISEFFAKYALLRECPSLVADFRADVGRAIRLIVGMIEAEEQNFFPLYSLDVKVDQSEQVGELAS